MNFKVGDMIRVKKNYQHRSNTGRLLAGNILKIRGIGSSNMNNKMDYAFLDTILIGSGIWFDEIEHFKNTPKTEIEFLDAIKENMRDG